MLNSKVVRSLSAAPPCLATGAGAVPERQKQFCRHDSKLKLLEQQRALSVKLLLQVLFLGSAGAYILYLPPLLHFPPPIRVFYSSKSNLAKARYSSVHMCWFGGFCITGEDIENMT